MLTLPIESLSLSACAILTFVAGSALRRPSTFAATTILHNTVWALSFAVIATGIMNYNPLSGKTWLLIVLGIVLFNIGAWAGSLPAAKAISRTEKDREPGTFGVSKALYVALLLGFTVGFAVYLKTISSLFGLSALISNPESIRAGESAAYLSAFPLYGKILFYLGPICFILTSFTKFLSFRLRWPTRVTVLSYLVIAQAAALQRTNLFVCLAWAAGVLILQRLDTKPARGPRPKGRIIAFATLGLVALAIFQGLSSALGKNASANYAVSSHVDREWRDSPYLTSFHYLSSGTPAFNALTSSKDDRFPPPPSIGRSIYGDYNPLLLGKATLVGPLKLAPISQPWEEVSPFVNIPEPTNVYTWLEPWYRDFRAPGVLLGSSITGFIISVMTRLRNRGGSHYLIASYLIGLTLFAPFINRYMSVMSLVIYAVVPSLAAVSASRKEAPSSETSPLITGRPGTSDVPPKGFVHGEVNRARSGRSSSKPRKSST